MKIRLIIKIIILFGLVCIMSCAHHARRPPAWTKGDMGLMGTFAIGQALNTAQINDIYHRLDEEYYEINPMIDDIYDEFGMEGVIAWKAIGTALVGTLAHYCMDWRDRILKISHMIIWGLVSHDYVLGLRFRF